MASLIPHIWCIVFGFVYLSAFFFFILSFLKINNLELPNYMHYMQNYVPYLAVIVIFSSSIVGFAAQTLIEKVIVFKYPEYAYNYNVANAIVNRQEINDVYANLILFRHLCFATLLFGISLFIWLRKQQSRFRYRLPLAFCFLSLLFMMSYFIIKKDFNQYKCAVERSLHTP